MANPVPGTPEWFQEIADQLLDDSGGGPVTDTQISALIAGLETLSHAAVVGVANPLATQARIDAIAASAATIAGVRQVLQDQLTAGDDDTLAAANAYTDSHSGSGGVSPDDLANAVAEGVSTSTAYTDDQANVTLTGANAYTDQSVGAATTAMEAYADNGDVTFQAAANTYTDNSITTLTDALTTAMDSKDAQSAADTLAAAIQYVNDHPGGGASSAYVDNGDAATLSAAKSYADSHDSTTLATAKTYTDNAQINTQTYADNKDVTNLAAAKTYADSKDATNLAAAKTYADQYAIADSGWITPTIAAGFTAGSTLQYRLIGHRVQLKGAIVPNAGANVAAAAGVATLPAGSRPIATLAFIVIGGVATVWARILVNADGTIDISAPNGTTTSVRFDQVTFLNN